MIREETAGLPEPGRSPRLQFGISSLLATALMLALLFGHLRAYGTGTVITCGLIVLVAALVGGLAGACAGRVADTLFWSVIGAVFGYLVVVGFYRYHWSAQYAWPLVGMVAGIAVGALGSGRPVRRAAIGLAAATGVFATYALAMFGFAAHVGYEALCAALGGALMGLVADVAERFERRTSIPRHVAATALVIAAILGHRIVPSVVPGL